MYRNKSMLIFFRVRLAFDAIFRKSATLQDVAPTVGGPDAEDTPTSTHSVSNISKKVQLVSNIPTYDNLQ